MGDHKKYSHIQIAGGAIMPVIRGFHSQEFCSELLTRWEFDKIEREKFYPLCNYLGLLREIDNSMPALLKKIGKFICREANVPADLGGFERILMNYSRGYLRQHRGFAQDELGKFECEKKSETEYVMVATDPYPCSFDQGTIMGFAQMSGLFVKVEHVDGICKLNGNSECKYLITVTI